MKKSIYGSIAALALVWGAASAHAGEAMQLFNGKDLSGWKMLKPGEFVVEDGHLVTVGGMGLLYFEKQKFGDCEIKVVFKTDGANDNSGVFIRVNGEPKDPWFAVHNGYEVQIDNGGDDSHRTGALYSFTKVKERVETKAGEYATMVIKLDGDRTTVHLNGTLVTDFTEGDPVPPAKGSEPKRGPRPKEGYIGLQNHDAKAKVRFKEVSVTPLKK